MRSDLLRKKEGGSHESGAVSTVSYRKSSFQRLLCDMPSDHVTARPDIFQPCGTLLTKEEYEAMQKDETNF